MFKFYVYVYLNPLKQGEFCFGKTKVKYEPFYIGKGKSNRINVHNNVIDKRNKLKQHVINKIKLANKNPIIIKLYQNITEYSAFRLEKYFINEIGRRDLGFGTLTNLTNGGEGTSGTQYTREKRNNMISNKQSIIKYNINGIVVETFENITDLSIKYPKTLTNHIHRACKSFGGRKVKNHFWKYGDGELIGDIVELNDKFKEILQYDLDGKFIKEWNCTNKLYSIGYAGGVILKCCRNNRKNIKYYKFKNYMWFFKNGDITQQLKSYSENNAKGSNRLELRNIKRYSLANELLGTYTPKKLKNMGFFTKTIYGCCNGKFITTQGYKWEWA
ncbi:MAG: hypothetical protein PF487_14735 [Bacteroidales bacterium]|nr:hypothetical protein [Bacteroidales bacterium]